MSDVIKALNIKGEELEKELQSVIEERDAEVKAARSKYAAALKEIKAKQGRLKRMVTASEKL